MRVIAILRRFFFSAREEFQVSYSYPYTRVSLGCHNTLILVSSFKRMCKLCLVSPSLSFLKGVAKLKDLQDEVSYVLVIHLEASIISVVGSCLVSYTINPVYLLKLHLRML